MRLRQLDGLRGIAALVVLLHHSLLMFPSLARAHADDAPRGFLQVLLFRTPIHLLWDGSGAVGVFFVLSGFVLTIAVEGVRVSWVRFFGQRIVRLYVPTWAAVALSVVLCLLVPRLADPTLGPWMNEHAAPLQGQVFNALLLAPARPDFVLHFGETPVNSSLWSLHWEVLFSLLLPVCLAYVRLLRKHPRLVVAGTALVGMSAFVVLPQSRDVLTYVPQFLLGVMIAEFRGPLVERTRRLGTSLTLLLGLALVQLPWSVPPIGAIHVTRVFIPAVGAAVLVAALVAGGRGASALMGQPWQWLGRVSFSLYLVHEPIVVSMGYLVPLWCAVPLGMVISLLAAAVFYRVVERRAHRFAKRIVVGR